MRSKKHSSSTGVITVRLNIFTASTHYFYNNRAYENTTTTSQTLRTMMVTGATKVICDLTELQVVTSPAGVTHLTGVDFVFLSRNFLATSSVTSVPAPPLSGKAVIRLYLVLPSVVLNWAHAMGLRWPVLTFLTLRWPRMRECME